MASAALEVAGVSVSPDHYIDGQRVASRRCFDLFSPIDQRPLGQVAEGESDHVEMAIQAAQRAYPAWSAMSAVERKVLLDRFADEIGKVDFCEPDALGHCQDQCEIGLRELLAVLHRDGVPTQNGSSLAKGERSASRFLLDLRDLKAREVVLHEENPLLSACEQNR